MSHFSLKVLIHQLFLTPSAFPQEHLFIEIPAFIIKFVDYPPFAIKGKMELTEEDFKIEEDENIDPDLDQKLE